jgi:hypothetical protein
VFYFPSFWIEQRIFLFGFAPVRTEEVSCGVDQWIREVDWDLFLKIWHFHTSQKLLIFFSSFLVQQGLWCGGTLLPHLPTTAGPATAPPGPSATATAAPGGGCFRLPAALLEQWEEAETVAGVDNFRYLRSTNTAL